MRASMRAGVRCSERESARVPGARRRVGVCARACARACVRVRACEYMRACVRVRMLA